MLWRPQLKQTSHTLYRISVASALFIFSALVALGNGQSSQPAGTLALLSDQSAATYHLETGKWDSPQTQTEQGCNIDSESSRAAKTTLFAMDPDTLNPISGQAAWPMSFPNGQSPVPSAWVLREDGAEDMEFYLLFEGGEYPQQLIIERLDLHSGRQDVLPSPADSSSHRPNEHPPLYTALGAVVGSLDGTSVSLPEPIGGLDFFPDSGGKPFLIAISQASNPATLYRIALDEAGRPAGWMSILSIDMSQWRDEDHPRLTGVTHAIITRQGSPKQVLFISFDDLENTTGDGIIVADFQSGKILQSKVTNSSDQHAENPLRGPVWSDPMALHSVGGSLYLLAHAGESLPHDCAPRIQLTLNGPERVYFGDQTEFQLTIANSGPVPVSGISLEASHAENHYLQELFLAANHGENQLPIGTSIQLDIPFTVRQDQAQSMVFSVSATGNYKSVLANAAAELPIDIRSKVLFNKTGPDTASGGDTIEYQLTLQNTTVAALAGGIVSDENIGFLAQLSLPLFQDDFNSAQLSPQWSADGSEQAWHLQQVGMANSSLQPDLKAGADDQPRIFISMGEIWEDYSMLIDLRISAEDDSESCVGLRLNPRTGAGYYLCTYPHQGTLRLWKANSWNASSSGHTLLAEAESPLAGQWHHLRADLESNDIRIYWDGNLIINAQDPEFRSGTIGLMYSGENEGSSADIEFDNVLVSSNPPMLDVNGRVTFTVNYTIFPEAADPYINKAFVSAENGLFPIEQEATHELRLLLEEEPPPDNNPLIGQADQYETLEDFPLVVPAERGVLVNDGNTSPAGLTAIIGKPTMHGSLEFEEDGAFVYTPLDDFFGEDGFTYRVNNGRADSDLVGVKLIIVAINDPPSGLPDQYQLNEDQDLLINRELGVLNNDHDPDGDQILARLRDEPEHGILAFSADGAFRYVPDVDFAGKDRFTYVAYDGAFESEPIPVLLMIEPPNRVPVGVDDQFSLTQGGTLSLPPPGVLSNDFDPDGDAISVSLAVNVAHGKLELLASGAFRYTPAAGYLGADSFSYIVSDGAAQSELTTATLTIEVENQAPMAVDDEAGTPSGKAAEIPVLDNDLDPDGDALEIISVTQPEHGSLVILENDALLYTPDEAFIGTEILRYAVADGRGGEAEGSITIVVAPTSG